MSVHSTNDDQPIEGKIVEKLPYGLRDATQPVGPPPESETFCTWHSFESDKYYGYNLHQAHITLFPDGTLYQNVKKPQ